ncbi:MurR/RpiR family transcriptional regulator [Absicoccus intestinalis]|uniref:MurR/RpiR family transcriptional regulator n=1 Tax=Absicoccus intestinalis TaxID=2926319 RepID=A0ABU4WJD0_9FIRM|nr:MurR/RpiR family transcriptional regulator [Absicoccus sp. CLA-KB-P134]MDX8416349.1 MurR/RpiR family transcriptional regulator [Absicoccus sp. CLA-KB-P134]
MNSNDILVKIDSIRPFFSNTEMKIADTVLEDPKNVILLSTKAFSEKCGVSEPSLIRFTKKLGLSGFKEFKLMLSATLGSQSTELYPMNIYESDSPLEVYEKLSTYIIASIQSTQDTLNNEDLQKAVDLIELAYKKKKTIFLSGMGASSLQVKNLQIKLMRLGMNAVFYDDIHLRLEACTNLKKGDLLICITTLGSAIENYQIMEVAKKRGVQIILLTQYGNKKIAKYADVVLYTSVMENSSRLVSHAAIAVQNLIIDTIFFSLAFHDYERITEGVYKARRIFDEYGHYAHLEGDFIKK